MDDESKASADLPTSGVSPPSPPPLNKKRKSPAPLSRGVASLTPEQLAKKRANDREAQRAIRERTKNHIDRLQKRIDVLTSQKPYLELQEVLRQKQAIQDENDEIKKRLSSVIAILQPLSGSQGAAGADISSLPSSNLTSNREGEAVHTECQKFPSPSADPPSRAAIHNLPSPISFASEILPPTNVQSQHRLWLQGGGHGNELQSWSSVNAFECQRNSLQHALDLDGSGGQRLRLQFLLETHHQLSRIPTLHPGGLARGNSSPPTLAPSPSQHSSRSPSQLGLSFPTHLPRWALICNNTGPTCPLDHILLDFMNVKRREATSRGSVYSSEQLGPHYPSVSSLLNNNDQHPSVDPLSKVFADIISKFPNITGLPEKVAVLYNMFFIMRWQIHPTLENFQRLPVYLHPTALQVQCAHPAWVDYVPWPSIRDKLISDPSKYPFQDFFVPFTARLSVNWPYLDTDTLLISNSATPSSKVNMRDEQGKGGPGANDHSRPTTSPEIDGELLINPVFERHLRDLGNWSLGPEFETHLSELAEGVRMK